MKAILCLLPGLFLVTTVFAEEVTAHHCVALSKIDLGDNEILNKERQQELFRPYMGRCVDGKLLKAILADVFI